MTSKKKIDIIITSSSRPELLKHTISYFKKFVHFQGSIRFFLHEDFLFKEESEKLIDYAQSEFGEENVWWHDPPMGLIESTAFLLKKVKTDYVIYLQDDWCFERPLELDRVIYTMDRYPNVNSIIFNKYNNMKACSGIEQTEEDFPLSNMKMCKFYSWSFLPSIWRTDFVVKHYMIAKDKSKYPKRNDPVITAPARMNRYLKYNNIELGIYLWGKTFEPRMVRHIGQHFRAEAHHREKDGGWGTEGESKQKAGGNFIAKWLDYEHLEGIC